MLDTVIYKVKDSVDLFLTDEKILTAYFMNSRQRKNFKVNNVFIKLIENIDGKTTLIELKSFMKTEYNITGEEVENIIDMMIANRIITEVNTAKAILNDNDIIRYERQINYFSEFLGSEEEGFKAQKKINNAKIMIFGCGAIGGDIALELVMAGVRNIGLFDYDVIDESDISRHMFYNNNCLGDKKIEVLKSKIMEIDSETDVSIYDNSLRPDDDIEEIIINYDFIVNTLDEPYIGYTSSKISRLCIKHNKPHFIAGGFDAHLASTGELIIPYVTPCVECYTTHFKESLKDWKPKSHPVKNRHLEIGGLASMSLFSASFACIEIIKYIAGLVALTESFKIRGEFLFNDFSLNYLDVKRNPKCLVCGGDSKL